MVSKGQKLWAPFLGFFEVFIWLVAITRIIQNLDNWLCYFAYAGGFATGNYIGLIIEEKMAIGIVKIQIIARKESNELINNLKNAGYGFTHHEAHGGTEDVSMIYSIINRIEIAKVEEIIKSTNPNAFYTIEDVKSANSGIFRVKTGGPRWRKGK
jgi:uncharacterized protein YebE (UPF0316 family)